MRCSGEDKGSVWVLFTVWQPWVFFFLRQLAKHRSQHLQQLDRVAVRGRINRLWVGQCLKQPACRLMTSLWLHTLGTVSVPIWILVFCLSIPCEIWEGSAGEIRITDRVPVSLAWFVSGFVLNNGFFLKEVELETPRAVYFCVLKVWCFKGLICIHVKWCARATDSVCVP